MKATKGSGSMPASRICSLRQCCFCSRSAMLSSVFGAILLQLPAMQYNHQLVLRIKGRPAPSLQILSSRGQQRAHYKRLEIQKSNMSAPTTLQVNDMVFVASIGYGTLVDCGSLMTLTLKDPVPGNEKKQSIYFDPDMFNSEPDSLNRRKSEIATALVEKKNQAKEPAPSAESTIPVTNSQPQPSEHASKPEGQQVINIVKVRLQGSQVLVFTPDTNIRKYVVVPVRPLFAPALGVINIKIEIGKTIQSFKREIFDVLGLKHGHYQNVRFFTTSPVLQELSMQAKTIWQYGIRENSILTMTAEHGFCFEALPTNLGEHFALANNNLTLASLPKKPKQAENVVIALPPPAEVEASSTKQQPPNPPPNPPATEPAAQTQPKPQVKSQASSTGAGQAGQSKQQQNPRKQQQKAPQFLFVNGDKYIRSGKHYFQVKLDKLPTNPQHLKLGLASPNNAKKYLFSPLTHERAVIQNQEVREASSYGIAVKQNDSIGVLVKIDRQRRMKVTFYKNNASLGLCFEDKVEEVHMVFGVGSEAQISLDTRIQPPIDSYRF